jgi:hypothetical protein
LDRLVSGWFLLFLYLSDCQMNAMPNRAHIEWCWRMVEKKERTNEGSLGGMVKPVTNSFVREALKTFNDYWRHFLELLQKSVPPAQRSQLSYNVKGKVEEIET